ncbi:MAG TPA: hypothetical protein VM076_12360 [Gemmatimonadaceae bacterium]|nr:hypothetical protein [Gemmatimonadaceae bacterium]
MERNADDMFGATGDQSSTAGGNSSFGVGGQGMAGNTAPAGGLDYSATGAGASGTTESKVDQVKAGAQNKLSQAKDKAKELQSSLADRLDSGAEKLRQRAQTNTLAGATGAGSTAVADEKMAKMNDSVATGMEKSADWLRNGDLKADVERQVRDNPGRTLLIALGVGYLLGKAFRSER